MIFYSGMRGGAKVVVEAHKFPGVFVVRGKEDALATLNGAPGKQVYQEKLVKVDVSDEGIWDPPFRQRHETHTRTHTRKLNT